MKFRQLFSRFPPNSEPDTTSECHDSSATTTNDTPLSATFLSESSVAPIISKEISTNCEVLNNRPLNSNFHQGNIDLDSAHSGTENGSEDKDRDEATMDLFEKQDAEPSNHSAISFLVELDLYQNLPSLHTLGAGFEVDNEQITKTITKKSKQMQQLSEKVEEDIHAVGSVHRHENAVEGGTYDTVVPAEIFGEIPDLPMSTDNTPIASVSAICPNELHQPLSDINFDFSHSQLLSRIPSSLDASTVDDACNLDDEASMFMSHIHLLREVNLRTCTKNTPSPSTDEYIGGSDGSPENDAILSIPSTARTMRASASTPELRSRHFRGLRLDKDRGAIAPKSASAFNPAQNNIQQEAQVKTVWGQWKLIGLAISAGSTAVVIAILWG